jgi:hypothetical protein
MEISEQILSQLERLKKTGSFSLSMPYKKELARINNEIGGQPMPNLMCGTCVRTAMHNLNRFLTQKETKPVLAFKGVKSINEMTFNELRTKAKANGFKANRKTTKIELIKFLK